MYIQLCQGEGNTLTTATHAAEQALTLWHDAMKRDQHGTPMDYAIVAYSTSQSQHYHPERGDWYTLTIAVTYTFTVPS